MKRGQFHLRMDPVHGGAFTRWRLTGSVVTAIPYRQMRQLIESLSLWSGWPVELVLPADITTAHWFEWWTHIVDTIPEHALHVRFVLCRPKKRHDPDVM